MGHRALLAYRRDATDESIEPTDSTEAKSTDTNDSDDPTYDLHRSHWGGDDFALLDFISPETPFATESHFAVDPEPIATDLSMSDIVTNYLNFLHHEAFYRVSTDYRTTAFHVLWFGLEADAETVERSETVGHGALVEAVPEDANYVRGWFRGAKTVLGDLLDGEGPAANGNWSNVDEVSDYLTDCVTAWDDNREVIVPE